MTWLSVQRSLRAVLFSGWIWLLNVHEPALEAFYTNQRGSVGFVLPSVAFSLNLQIGMFTELQFK